jgi:peroxiredoxin
MKYLLAGLLLLAAPAEPPAIRAVVIPVADRKPAPAFRLADGSNRPRALSSYRGKIVLLDFWATECGGCKVEIPWFMQFARQYKSDGLEVVGVSEDIPYEGLKDAAEGWSRVKPFIEKQKINYPIVMGDDAVTKTYRIMALPVTYLIDRQGRIAAEYVGLVDKDDIERNIKALLKERAS